MLLDIRMPGASFLAETLRSPAHLWSSSRHRACEACALRLDAVDYLTKPIATERHSEP